MPLTSFENIQGIGVLSKNAKSRIDFVRLEIQCHGTMEHGVTAEMIRRKTDTLHRRGLSGPEVRSIVHFLRQEGYPIGSSGNGYYWAFRPKDLDPTIEHLKQRINAIQNALNAVRKAKMKLKFEEDGQGRLF